MNIEEFIRFQSMLSEKFYSPKAHKENTPDQLLRDFSQRLMLEAAELAKEVDIKEWKPNTTDKHLILNEMVDVLAYFFNMFSIVEEKFNISFNDFLLRYYLVKHGQAILARKHELSEEFLNHVQKEYDKLRISLIRPNHILDLKIESEGNYGLVVNGVLFMNLKDINEVAETVVKIQNEIGKDYACYYDILIFTDDQIEQIKTILDEAKLDEDNDEFGKIMSNFVRKTFELEGKDFDEMIERAVNLGLWNQKLKGDNNVEKDN